MKDVQHKERQVEELRVEYAVQLVQTNKSQSEYYECDLPSALDSLQKICEGQCLYFASVMTRYNGNPILLLFMLQLYSNTVCSI